jgi:CSLREA domain-containing protein
MTRLSRLVVTLLALVVPVATAPLAAAVFQPNKTADTADGACDRDCSLREAVLAANASAGEDVILLPAGTYRLTLPGAEDAAATGDLDVLDDLLLLGDGAPSTVIEGAAADRLFQVAGGAALELRDVTLRNGRAAGNGGAIANEGTLTVLRARLADNASAAGAFGGAIHSDGLDAVLVVRDSTFDHNSGGARGGALAAGDTLTLANVTVSANGTAGAGLGGGIYVFANSTTTINNATITGNSAGQGEGGGLYAESSAFTGPAPKVSNSILAGNLAGSKPDCAAALDSSYLLVGIGTGCILPAGRNDQVGTAASPLNPNLGGLLPAGGPTPTHVLLEPSPAHDAGNPAAPGSGGTACENTDQRGAERGADRCDIGAYERTTACVAGGDALCLAGGRFLVRATFQPKGALPQPAQGETLTGDSGYFWFFDQSNVEVTVKLLDACSLNDRFWVFASGLTNVRVVLTVTDTETGAVKSYVNPLNRTFVTITDTSAFDTCP